MKISRDARFPGPLAPRRAALVKASGLGLGGILLMISLAELQARIASGALSPDAAIEQSRTAIEEQDKVIERSCAELRTFVCRRVRCVASLSASRTSSTHQSFRPRWAHRSTAAGAPARTHRSS